MILELLAADPNAHPGTLAHLVEHARTRPERVALLTHPNLPALPTLEPLLPDSHDELHDVLVSLPTHRRAAVLEATALGVRWAHVRKFDDLTAAEVGALWPTRTRTFVPRDAAVRAMLTNAHTPRAVVRAALRSWCRRAGRRSDADFFLALVAARRVNISLTWHALIAVAPSTRRALRLYLTWARSAPGAPLAQFVAHATDALPVASWKEVLATTSDVGVAAEAFRRDPTTGARRAFLDNERLGELHLANAQIHQPRRRGSISTHNRIEHAQAGPGALAAAIATADAGLRPWALENGALTAQHLADLAELPDLSLGDVALIAAHPHAPAHLRRALLARADADQGVTEDVALLNLARAELAGEGRAGADLFVAHLMDASFVTRWHYAAAFTAVHSTSPATVAVATVALALENQFTGTLSELLDTAAAIAGA